MFMIDLTTSLLSSLIAPPSPPSNTPLSFCPPHTMPTVVRTRGGPGHTCHPMARTALCVPGLGLGTSYPHPCGLPSLRRSGFVIGFNPPPAAKHTMSVNACRAEERVLVLLFVAPIMMTQLTMLLPTASPHPLPFSSPTTLSPSTHPSRFLRYAW